jgi:hypothetical protein
MAGVLALMALLSGCSTAGRPVPIAGVVADNDGPDADVHDFRIGLTPAIECEVEGQRLPFTFDMGASSSDFSVRYYERFVQAPPTGAAGRSKAAAAADRSHETCSFSRRSR